MKLIRTLIRLPVINIFTFAFLPKLAYKEYFMWVLEEQGLTIEDIWDKLKPEDKKALKEFNIQPACDGLCQQPPIDISGCGTASSGTIV